MTATWSRIAFLKCGSAGIWGWIILCHAGLRTVGCSAASWPLDPVIPPTPVVTPKNVSGHCQVGLRGRGVGRGLGSLLGCGPTRTSLAGWGALALELPLAQRPTAHLHKGILQALFHGATPPLIGLHDLLPSFAMSLNGNQNREMYTTGPYWTIWQQKTMSYSSFMLNSLPNKHVEIACFTNFLELRYFGMRKINFTFQNKWKQTSEYWTAYMWPISLPPPHHNAFSGAPYNIFHDPKLWLDPCSYYKEGLITRPDPSIQTEKRRQTRSSYLGITQELLGGLRVLVPDEVLAELEEILVDVVIHGEVPCIHNRHVHTKLGATQRTVSISRDTLHRGQHFFCKGPDRKCFRPCLGRQGSALLL